MGHMGLSGEREGQPGWVVRLLPPVRIGLGEGGGGGAPLSFSLSPFLSPF